MSFVSAPTQLNFFSVFIDEEAGAESSFWKHLIVSSFFILQSLSGEPRRVFEVKDVNLSSLSFSTLGFYDREHLYSLFGRKENRL